MRSSVLRHYVKNAKLQRKHFLNKCNLVIDGDSYFKNSYLDSGCQFLVGPECDSYAKYLINNLLIFQKCNITCYVIFKGSTKHVSETTQLIDKHQTIINDRRNVSINPRYFEPVFVKEIQQEVLDALNIKYFCCEYDSTEAIIGVAREFKCPVLTNNVEYCLYGISCILTKAVFDVKCNGTLECMIYEHDKCKSFFGLYKNMPIFLTAVSESINFLDIIPEWCEFRKNNDIRPLILWSKRQREDVFENISKHLDDDKRKLLINFYNKNLILYLYPTCNLAVKYFKRTKQYGLFKDDKKWFAKGVASGRIALPFIDIKRKSLIIGSTLAFNERKPDALQAASRIIAFSHCVLTNAQKSSLDFIGRKGTNSLMWKIDLSFETSIKNSPIFTKQTPRNLSNPFLIFVNLILNHREKSILLFIPGDCIILYITLAHYLNINETFMDGVYFVLLSYFMMNGRKFGNIIDKQSSKECSLDVYQACDKMYNNLKFLCDKIDLKHNCNTNIIHSLAELQHCLQYVNYLNRLCGSYYTPTCYSNTYNATFIYNAFVKFENRNNLMKYLRDNFGGLKSLKMYEDLIIHFNKIKERC